MSTPSSEDEEMQASADDHQPAATRTVALPERLVERVADRLEYTEYDAPADYVAFVLEETLARVEAESDDDPADIDRAEVQDRLESLGYLDS